MLIALSGIAAPAWPLEVLRLEIREEGRGYGVEFEALLAAEPRAVMAVLTDYASYPDLDARILEARVIGEESGRPVLFTRMRGCVGSIFCRTMERYDSLEEQPEELRANVIPGRGDLVSGSTVTGVTAAPGGSHVHYQTVFTPSFWMPRRLVRRSMRKTLSESTLAMFAAIEQRAAAAAPP